MPNTPPKTFRELLAHAVTRLEPVSDSPLLDAELLLAHALDRPRPHLKAWPDNRPDAEQLARFEDLLERRQRGEPMAYLLGEREFWSLRLEVTPDTLIPRHDTETLVEAALGRIPRGKHCRVVDLGTGSGAIALAIRHERPLADITATDASRPALDVARRNAARLGLDIRFVYGEWFAPLAGQQFDVIVSNPPYIADADRHLANGDLPHEPRSALASGPDGLRDIRQIVTAAPGFLAPGGWLLLEHGHEQGDAVRALLAAAGFSGLGCSRDLAGHERVSFGRQEQSADR